MSASKTAGTGGDATGSLFKTLKEFDIYHKVGEDYKVKTSGGATLSLIGWAIIFILSLVELNSYFSLQTTEHMVVDTTLGQQLRINVNVTFHALTCLDVHLDAMDVAGDNQLAMEHDMIKQRLSPKGFPVGSPGVEVVGVKDEIDDPLPANYCGNCYGAESETQKCCNSCDELKLAYQKKGWSLNQILKDSDQCLRDKHNPFSNVRPGEGCRITGTMNVNKVAGNFHVVLGQAVLKDGNSLQFFNPSDAPKFNVSHTIHSVSFGDPYPSMHPNPLDSVTRIVDDHVGTGLYQYFIKVIPTSYINEWGTELRTNQYTITERFRPLADPKDEKAPDTVGNAPHTQIKLLPGIFFVYDMAPFLISVSRTRMSFLHFFTRLCAIVGGVFSVLSVLDAGVFRAQKILGTKNK